MSITIKRIYCNSKIEFSETPSDVCEGTRVVVTFLPPGSINLTQVATYLLT